MTMPVLQVRHDPQDRWWVAARWPNGEVENIRGFVSENDANAWIATEVDAWLENRRKAPAADLAAPVAPPKGLRPMADFDPDQPAVLHDCRSGRMLPWTGEQGADFKARARAQAHGLVAFDGLLLDGWGHPLGG